MNSRYNLNKLKEKSKIETGYALIAQPFWDEEIYQKSVALIIEHNSKGTTGILLNQKSTLMVSEAIPSLKISKPLYFGGKLDTKIISYIHNNNQVPDSIYLGNNLYWGGNFEQISDMLLEKEIELNEINFYAGFVYWSPGQLEEEVKKNKWWLCELNDHDLFYTSMEELWGNSLESIENIYSLFRHIPDPSFN